MKQLWFVLCVAGCPSPQKAPVVTNVTRATPSHAHDALPEGAPCFADRATLDADAVYHELEQYIPAMWGDPSKILPTASYGSCKLENGTLRDAAGNTVATLHCGLTAVVPNITDSYGHQVGTSGKRVAESYPNAKERIVCISNGDDMARCLFRDEDNRNDGEEEQVPYHYVVPGSFSAGMLRGELALSFFTQRTVAMVIMRGWCH